MSAPDKVIVYGNTTCGYCGAARMLLTRKGIEFEDIVITDDPQLRAEMEDRSGRRSVPQIFFGDKHIGGFDDLYALETSGELDNILTGNAGEH